VKFKKLAGGGYFKIVNASVPLALERLGYAPEQIREIVAHVVGRLSLKGAPPPVNRESLIQRGLTDADISVIEDALPAAFELSFALTPRVLGKEAMGLLGFDEDIYTREGFDLLSSLGFTAEQIEKANDYICGYQTIEGAPHLKADIWPSSTVPTNAANTASAT